MQVLQVEEGYCAEKQSQTRNSMLISGFLKIRDSLTVLTPVILTEIGSLWLPGTAAKFNPLWLVREKSLVRAVRGERVGPVNYDL